MSRKVQVGLLVVALTAVGVAVGVAVRRPRLKQEGPPIDPRISAWDPLVVGGEGNKFLVSWNDGASPPFTFFRKVRGWEPVAGRLALRVELTYPKRRRRDEVFVTEWVQPRVGSDGEAELVCVRRKIGLQVVPLDPPQPVLRTPLEPGRTWAWRGTAGGFEAEATFTVLPLSSDGELRVEQKTVARAASEQVESLRVRTYAPQRGLVAEAGTFPVAEPNRPYDRQRSKLAKTETKTAAKTRTP